VNRLVVAFDNEQTITRVREMLASASLTPRSTHRTGAEIVRAVRFMGGGTIVCGVKLLDMTADQLYTDLEGMAHMLVIGKPLHLEMYATCDVFKLALPINRFDLSASVRMLLQLEEMDHKRKNRRTARENQMIEGAKELLQSTFGMTEAEAHRYLQKRSMDAGVRITETAAMIIDSYSKGN
jgi:response regulator NasT